MDSVIMDILSDIHEPQRVTSIKNHQEENPGAVCQAIGVMKQHLQKQKDHGLDVIPLLTGRFYLPVNIHSMLIVFYSHPY